MDHQPVRTSPGALETATARRADCDGFQGTPARRTGPAQGAVSAGYLEQEMHDRAAQDNPTSSEPSRERPGMERLLAIMARLRDPSSGCPWDRAQTFATIAPYTVEEAYEVADAIERADLGDLKEELGDLLFQVVFHSRMAEEAGAFDFDAVAHAISDKMIRRHPHIFADQAYQSEAEQKADWEALKARERAAKGRAASILDDVPVGLPALTRAAKLTKRAARVGFDWSDIDQVLGKLEEEIAELRVEIANSAPGAIRDEFGDVLFVMANLARKLDLEPEDALRSTNAKFIRRFGYIEAHLAASGRSPEDATLEEMDVLWEEAKALEKASRQIPVKDATSVE